MVGNPRGQVICRVGDGENGEDPNGEYLWYQEWAQTKNVSDVHTEKRISISSWESDLMDGWRW